MKSRIDLPAQSCRTRAIAYANKVEYDRQRSLEMLLKNY